MPAQADDGPAVYLLDLTARPDVLLARMSASRRRQLRQWDRERPVLVTDRGRLLDFILARSAQFFHERSAGAAYDLPAATWQQLLGLPDVLAIGAEHEGEVVAAYLFGTTPRCADYLFGFTASGFEHLSSGLVWEAVTVLATAGVPLLNLGGGIAPGDGVSTFKQRFGPHEARLRALREVYRPERYEALCAAAGADSQELRYFPPYRGPTHA